MEYSKLVCSTVRLGCAADVAHLLRDGGAHFNDLQRRSCTRIEMLRCFRLLVFGFHAEDVVMCVAELLDMFPESVELFAQERTQSEVLSHGGDDVVGARPDDSVFLDDMHSCNRASSQPCRISAVSPAQPQSTLGPHMTSSDTNASVAATENVVVTVHDVSSVANSTTCDVAFHKKATDAPCVGEIVPTQPQEPSPTTIAERPQSLVATTRSTARVKGDACCTIS